jgi:hypothetical protein
MVNNKKKIAVDQVLAGTRGKPYVINTQRWLRFLRLGGVIH